MAPRTLEIQNPEDLRSRVEEEFAGRLPVYFASSPEQGVEALLVIEVPQEEDGNAVQARAAEICAAFHDQTGRLVVPIAVPADDPSPMWMDPALTQVASRVPPFTQSAVHHMVAEPMAVYQPTLQDLIQLWPRFLDEAKRLSSFTYVLLRETVPLAVEQETLVIGVPEGDQRIQLLGMGAHGTVIDAAVNRVYGPRLRGFRFAVYRLASE